MILLTSILVCPVLIFGFRNLWLDRQWHKNHILTRKSFWFMEHETPYAFKSRKYFVYQHVHTGEYIFHPSVLEEEKNWISKDKHTIIADWPSDTLNNDFAGLYWDTVYRKPSNFDDYFLLPSK